MNLIENTKRIKRKESVVFHGNIGEVVLPTLKEKNLTILVDKDYNIIFKGTGLKKIEYFQDENVIISLSGCCIHYQFTMGKLMERLVMKSFKKLDEEKIIFQNPFLKYGIYDVVKGHVLTEVLFHKIDDFKDYDNQKLALAHFYLGTFKPLESEPCFHELCCYIDTSGKLKSAIYNSLTKEEVYNSSINSLISSCEYALLRENDDEDISLKLQKTIKREP